MMLKKLCALLLAVVLTLGLCSCSIGKKGKYEKAVDAVRNGRYQEAIESLESLDGYEDSAKYITYAYRRATAAITKLPSRRLKR